MIFRFSGRSVKCTRHVDSLTRVSLLVRSPGSFDDSLGAMVRVNMRLTPCTVANVALVVVRLVGGEGGVGVGISSSNVAIRKRRRGTLRVTGRLVTRGGRRRTGGILRSLLSNG